MEEHLHEQGYAIVAGVDEVGRGALAGPLTACAVVLAPGVRIDGLDDSKRLKPAQREAIAVQIRASAVTWHVEHVPAGELDALGMTEALRRAMNGALAGLDPTPDHVLVDGLPMHLGCTETAVVKGDSTVAAIAAASVLAKVARDALMCEFESKYPG
ncbi:ribonuclease HII, partial [bacterium]|nr:ribonuclease HII [bacterium]